MGIETTLEMDAHLFGDEDYDPITIATVIVLLSTVAVVMLALVHAFAVYYVVSFRNLYRQDIPGNQVFPLREASSWIFSYILHGKGLTMKELLQYGCGMCYVHQKAGMWIFWSIIKPILILSHSKTVEPVLTSNENLQKGFEYNFLASWLKEGLLTSKGDKWRRRRKFLTPAFHFRTLDQFFPIFNDEARVLCEKLDKEMQNEKWIDVSPLTSLCTLDIICETAMGKKINAQINESPYVDALHSACQIVIDRIIQPWLWPNFIYNLTSSSRKYNECMKIMDAFTRTVIAERQVEMLKLRQEKSGDETSLAKVQENIDVSIGRKRRLALLDLLLDEHFKDPSFTLDDIAEEVDDFMFAGHDTTSSGMSFAMYMIGLHQDVQAKVREEINSVLGDDYYKPIELEDVKHFKYLDRVLKETRRLYPPVPFIGRDLEVDTNIDGHIIPKGTSIGIFIYMLHRNPEVFPNPEVFDPDRFLPENIATRHPFSYVPFSAGPRNCIGQKFATYQALVVMATIIRYFDIKSRDTRDKFEITEQIVLRTDPGLFLKFTPRSELKDFGDLTDFLRERSGY